MSDSASRIEQAEVAGAAHGSADWPIAAGMLQFAGITRTGGPVSEATPEDWRSLLLPLRYEGFTAVELANRWADLTLLDAGRLAALREVTEDLGLAVPGYIVAGRPITDVANREENAAYTHASLEAAAAFGAPIVCLGLHPFASRRPGAPLWFWTEQDNVHDDDPEHYGFVVRELRGFAQHAADLGISITVESYPGTAVGTIERTKRLFADVDHPAMGLNPDLGNLVRVQQPIEDWQDVVVELLPLANYWHVKNYGRAENPFTGTVFTHPTTLELGVVDYRKALRYALSIGFAGTIVVEHYGGDGIATSAANRDYVRRLLASILEEPLA